MQKMPHTDQQEYLPLLRGGNLRTLAGLHGDHRSCQLADSTADEIEDAREIRIEGSMMYVLPNSRRDELKKPLGRVVRKIHKNELSERVVSVGDMVTMTLKEAGIEPDVAVVDYKIERKEYKGQRFHAEEILHVQNPAGMITWELWNAVATAYASGKKTLIEVDGEEDLAALPAIYLAPENTTVIYGLPSHGMVVVDVGLDERRKVGEFLKEIEG